MIIIDNIITLCVHIMDKIVGFDHMYYIEFESIVHDDDDDDIEVECNCNLCYSVRNCMYFMTRRLNCKMVSFDHDVSVPGSLQQLTANVTHDKLD